MVYPLLKNKVAETQGLIAIMSQWGLTADQLLPTIDKINLTADNWAVSSEDLVNGLNRSSGAARVLGLTLEETISILTVMREATGRTGKEVGNALNSILSFMQRPSAIKAFETQGIRVFADEARTQFRNVIEIFDEMAAKWPQMSKATQNMFMEEAEAAGLYSEEMAELAGVHEQWTDIQQRDLSQAAAGIYRRNYLLALLKNWAKVDEVLIGMEDALGYSMRENERTMATLAKQWEALKAAAGQFAVAIGDAGLLEELKRVVVFSKDAVDAFNNMDDSLQTLLITFAEITLAIKLFAAVGKMAGISGGLSAAGGILAGWSVPIAASTSKVRALTQATTALTTVLKNVGKAFVGAFGGPYLLGVTLAVTAITALVRNARNAEAALIEQGAVAEELIGTYDQLHERLGTMQKGSDEYNATLKELADTEQTIAQALPSTIEGWDEQTQALIINREEMERLIEAKNKLKKSHQEEADELDTAIAELEKQRQEHEKEADYYETQKGVLQDLASHREELTEALKSQSEGSEEYNRISTELGETERLIGNIAQEAGEKRVATIDKILKALDGLIEKERQAASNTKIQEAQKTQDVINNTGRRLQAINAEIRAQQALLPGGQWYDDIPGFLKGKYNVLPGGEFWARNKLSGLQEEAAELQSVYDQHKKELDTALREIDALQREVLDIDSGSGSGASGVGSAGGSGGSAKTTDWLKEYIADVLSAVKAQELLNDSVQRVIGLTEVKIDYYTTAAMTVDEYLKSIEEENRLYDLLDEKQRGVSKQSDAIREAIVKLEDKQKSLNTSTDDGKEAYVELGDQVEDLNAQLGDLQTEWFKLEKAQRAITSGNFNEIVDLLDTMTELGAIDIEEQLMAFSNLDVGTVGLQDQKTFFERGFDLWGKYVEELSDKQIEAIEKEREAFQKASDERIFQYERQLEMLDQQTKEQERQQKIEEARLSVSKSQADLESARQKLTNVMEERNTRIFQDGIWQYIADPQAVRDAQKEVEDANQKIIDAKQKLNDTLLDIEQDFYREQVKAQIEAEKEKQAVKLDAYDEQISEWKSFAQGFIEDLQQHGLDTVAQTKLNMLGMNTEIENGLMQMLLYYQTYCGSARAELRALMEMSQSAGVMTSMASYDAGGPILADQVARVHAGEYMLNKDNVRSLGGFSGVERLIANINAPMLDFSAIGGQSGSPVHKTWNSSVHIGQVTLPNVVDASGLIRNLQQFSRR